MSAATASSTDTVTVYVRLLNEGTDVWRPVEAARLSETTFRLSEDPAPDDEEWTFQPGDIVVAEHRRGEREQPLVAVARASQIDERSWGRRRAAS